MKAKEELKAYCPNIYTLGSVSQVGRYFSCQAKEILNYFYIVQKLPLESTQN
jgi:hypothetical protein